MTSKPAATRTAQAPGVPLPLPGLLGVLLLGGLILLAGCDPDSGPAGLSDLEAALGPSHAHGMWTPGGSDLCSKEVHDRYSVVGPDGLLYPTWHPPVDPVTGCHFGHEHGRDPRGSALYPAVGPIPFGYANQQLDIYDPGTRRHEDHVGHKIEWENGVRMDVQGAAGALVTVHCDVLTKLHQGTHSRDAFTNNVHEIVYHLRCTDGSRMHITMLTAIGTPGEMEASCDRRRIPVGPATPVNSPDGGGHRFIPDRECVRQHILVTEGERSNFGRGLKESWETNNRIRTAEGNRTLVFFNPYFQVLLPSRYFDPTRPDGVGRTLELCADAWGAGRRGRGGPCGSGNALTAVGFGDPASPFTGAARFVDINQNRITNAQGPEVWYSDPWGRNARTEPFPGSIRQFVARVDNTGLGIHGPVIGRNRDYSAPGVRAPN